MRFIFRKCDGDNIVLGCWGWMEGDISCDGLEKELVWELW